jgi:hypothetical protein
METRFESAIPIDPTLSHIHKQLQLIEEQKRIIEEQKLARQQAIEDARKKAKKDAKDKARAKQVAVVVSY